MARTTNNNKHALYLSLSLSLPLSLSLMSTLFECILHAAALIRLQLRRTVGPPCLCTAPFWLSVKKKDASFFYLPYTYAYSMYKLGLEAWKKQQLAGISFV